ncbi:oxidoreductase [Periweissella cryptocerci]|uniref:Oxidoreductase n=1 Tax=Periweissella cryptocerci TaxID=2506420 RepID=A0A4P6YU96_9LACO|nr:FAD/NAD(P)-binding protein [Periweissella cryptocerci]QBO36302.1 oxidoreductase [Periweissella cryptocerci]
MNIVIVGAGPRGLAVAERLLTKHTAENRTDALDIKMIDPTVLGGRVWNPSQDTLLLMNTVVQQLTLFADDSVNMEGPSWDGPNFYDWIKHNGADFLQAHPEIPQASAYLAELSTLNKNSFSSRGLFGVYAAWFYIELQAHADETSTLSFIRDTVTDITGEQAPYTVTTDDASYSADAIVMALGHADDTLNPEETSFKEYAAANGLTYVEPVHPAEVDLTVVPAKENVIVRGLGLSFFDYIIQLTQERGGQFIANADGLLTYEPSGNEPHILAGSRHGFPLHARGLNQKEYGDGYLPHFLTKENIDKLATQTSGKLAYNDFKHLVVNDMTYKYYINLATERKLDVTALSTALLASDDLNHAAKDFGFADADLYDFAWISNPAKDLPADADYRQFMIDYLKWDIADAAKGNQWAPYAGSFDILRDIRDTIRYTIEMGLLSNEAYLQFLKEFNPISVMVSVGPPRLRIQQIEALIEANVLEIMPGGLHVTPVDGHFVATTNRKDATWTADTVVEARLGPVNLQASLNPLQVNLRATGMMSTDSYTLADGETFSTGATIMDRANFELINANGSRQKSVYSFGIPAESYTWFTTFISRPGVNDKSVRDADKIASLIMN